MVDLTMLISEKGNLSVELLDEEFRFRFREIVVLSVRRTRRSVAHLRCERSSQVPDSSQHIGTLPRIRHRCFRLPPPTVLKHFFQSHVFK